MDFVGVFLDKGQEEPLYNQLYRYLAGAIRGGEIAEGERLPGKRSAAAQLGVSVNTVDTAYGLLAAEGYVEARPRSGFVVQRLGALVPPPKRQGDEPLPAFPHSTGAEASGLPPPEGGKAWEYNFSSGGVDPALFPRKLWNRLFRDVLAGDDELFTQGQPQGEEVLRRAIASYLRGYRGARCEAEQIVVGAGLELLTAQLARLFPEAAVAVENPGYTKSSRVLRNEGLAVLPVDIDGEGMRPDRLAESGAQLAYLTPSHHFPTGSVMPVGRRTELLRWAAAGNLIVEDDYDSEFRFESRPLPCLQGLDHAGRVVYAGTFSRSLSPGLRVAYLVLPPWLLRRWRAQYGTYACTVSRPEQHTLARLMEGGHFYRSVNRARAAYRHKRDVVIEGLQAGLPPGSFTLHNRHTGLYFLLRLQGGKEQELAARLRAKGIRIHAIGEYFVPPPAQGGAGNGQAESLHAKAAPTAGLPQRDALVVGYGGLAEAELAPGAAALCAALRGCL